MKNRRRTVWAMVLVLVSSIAVAWLILRPRDPTFKGRPESEWISHLSYHDDDQVKQWRDFGPDGARVLVRALEGANRPLDRFYRSAYRKMWRVLPGGFVELLPAPNEDLTRVTRMNLVDLLASLSQDAALAIPTMARALEDEDDRVRGLAITYFTRSEDENALLNQMDPRAKRKLLPSFLRAIQDNNGSVRNNAAIALRYYPEEAAVVVPALQKALQDPIPKVRQLAAKALNTIDPAAAAKAGKPPLP